MKNIRMISWLLITVLLLCSMAFPAVAEEEMKLLSIVAIEGETVWLHTSHGLVPFDKDGWQIGEALYPDADCYAIGPDGHIYYSIEGDIFAFDRDGNKVDEWDTPLDGVTKILAHDTYILLMGEVAYGAIHAENHELVAAAADGMQDMGFYGKDSFVVMDGSETILVDCTTLDVIGMANVFSYGGIIRSSEERGIYYYELGDIRYLSALNQKDRSYMSLPDKNYVNDVLMDDDSVYVIYKGELCRYPLPENAVESKVLTIVGGKNHDMDMRFTKTVEIFTQRHPEYTVVTTSYGNRDKVKTAIMANEPGYDLLVFDYNGGAEYKNSEMLLDFSGNGIIVENIAQWLDMPFLWESDGSLYGIPLRLYSHGFRIKKVLWDELGLEIDKDWTWDDFLSLAEVAREYGMKLTNDDGVWRTMRNQYESKYCDYAAGIADYDTEIFRKLASAWKQLDAENMIAYEFTERKNVFLEFGHASLWVVDADDYVYLGMPILEGEYVTPVGIEALYVNRFSEHAEMAEEFLEIYTSPEVQEWSSGGTMTFTEDVAHNEYFSMCEEMGYLQVVSDTIPTEAELEQWRFMLESGSLHETFGSLDYIGDEIINDFIEDKFTLEEFVAEVQERADLMIGE